MKAAVKKENMLEAVQLAERVVGKKESLPVLSCVLLEAGRGEFSIRATNLEAGIAVSVPSEVGEGGAVAVPAAVLSQVLRSVAGDTVSLRVEEGNLLAESRGSKTLIKGVPHQEFPPLGGVEGVEGVNLPRGDLLACLQAVSYAASPSMIRPELGSVYVRIEPSSLTCVATDSFRLAEKKVSLGNGDEESEILIPLKHAVELMHVLGSIGDDSVTLSADDSQMMVAASSLRYVSRVVEGTFPAYREIIPKSFAAEATVLKGEFADVLRKARIFAGNDQHVGLHVYPARKTLSATARSAEVGEMSDTVEAALEGDDLDINFHIGYLADCLSSISSDSIVLGFAGPGKALVVRGASDTSFMYLVMPLNR